MVLTAGRRCRSGRLGVDSWFKLFAEHVAGGVAVRRSGGAELGRGRRRELRGRTLPP